MNKSIVKRIAENADISWHPLTEDLHKSFMQSYNREFHGKIIEMFKDKSEHNFQTLYVTSNHESVKVLNKKNKIKGDKTRHNIDYTIIAGCFNPWFDKDILKDSKQLVAIELRPMNNQSKESFEEALQEVILLDFLKSLCQANMSYLGSNFFSLKKAIGSSSKLKQLYTELMGRKLSAKQYADYFGHKRDFVYKHRQK
ncbi:hypothetical protein [Psychrobacter sp. FDAARGOS_221]|uniref:hypothetical protein n=1 Tax=Psychrobacter sp. FDAARGOS_221 TaxID=1975705 RepID=UPI000BB5961D|nr:hypothetical protein [Psychrobacter sp. FDAARGOS_221]PNK61531.1 hypothetical protein A6J60_012095 [Psychrobacter sp. FDAARGOS_221]